jgi:hypothetical protein
VEFEWDPDKAVANAKKHGVDFSEDYKAYEAGTNVVFLEPDIAVAFPNSASVNQALPLLLRLSKTKAIVSGRPNKALQPTSRARSGRAKSKERSRAARG